MENAYIDVRPGQIWADNDKRAKGRRLRVDSIEGDYAHCTVVQRAEGVTIGLMSKKKLLISRFRPTSTGYLLMEDPSTGYVRPVDKGPSRWVQSDTPRGAAQVDAKSQEKKPEECAPKVKTAPVVVQPAPVPVAAPVAAAPVATAVPMAIEAEVPVDFICLIHPKYPTDSETVDKFYAKNAKMIWDAARADLLPKEENA